MKKYRFSLTWREDSGIKTSWEFEAPNEEIALLMGQGKAWKEDWRRIDSEGFLLEELFCAVDMKREKHIEEIIEAELDDMELDALLEYYKDERRASLEKGDDCMGCEYCATTYDQLPGPWVRNTYTLCKELYGAEKLKFLQVYRNNHETSKTDTPFYFFVEYEEGREAVISVDPFGVVEVMCD